MNGVWLAHSYSVSPIPIDKTAAVSGRVSQQNGAIEKSSAIDREAIQNRRTAR